MINEKEGAPPHGKTKKKFYEQKNKQLMQPRKDKICLLIVARPVQLLVYYLEQEAKAYNPCQKSFFLMTNRISSFLLFFSYRVYGRTSSYFKKIDFATCKMEEPPKVIFVVLALMMVEEGGSLKFNFCFTYHPSMCLE